MRLLLVLVVLGYSSGAPLPAGWAGPQPAIVQPGPVYYEQQQQYNQPGIVEIAPKEATKLVQDFENEVVRMYTLKTLAEGIKLEQAAEDKILQAAVETLQEEPSPERTKRLQEVGELLKRDKRAVEALSGLIGSSSGGGGGASASAGSDSGSILGLVGPLLGSSSGGGGDSSGGTEETSSSDSGSILNLVGPLLSSSSAGGGDGASAAAGSDSGSILSLVGPLLSSSSAGGGSGGDGASAAAGSDSGSILGLVGPLLSSSSAGAGGSPGGDGGASVSASAGSDSGSILNLLVPLLSSSSSSGGGDGGGSGLGSILSLSSSSKGGGGGGAGGGVAVDAGGHGGAGVISQIKGAKIALVGDKIQLLLRVKFGLLNKVLTTLTNKIAFASLPPHGGDLQDLKYPN